MIQILIIIFITNYYLSNSSLKKQNKNRCASAHASYPLLHQTKKENTKNSARKKQEKRKKIKIQTDKTTYVNVTKHIAIDADLVFFFLFSEKPPDPNKPSK